MYAFGSILHIYICVCILLMVSCMYATTNTHIHLMRAVNMTEMVWVYICLQNKVLKRKGTDGNSNGSDEKYLRVREFFYKKNISYDKKISQDLRIFL